jgi:hypothetical protein
MTKRIATIAITAAGLLLAEQGAATAATPVPTPRQLAATTCKTQRTTLGKAFRKRYGAHAMRACVHKQVPAARQLIADSTAECNDEISTDGVADFVDTWSDDDGTGAFENCVNDGISPVLDDSTDVTTDDGS